jgi:hypothetical protein
VDEFLDELETTAKVGSSPMKLASK